MAGRATLAAFVAELRTIGLPISVSENVDAMAAVLAMPIADRATLKSALAATLVKSADHYHAFERGLRSVLRRQPSRHRGSDRPGGRYRGRQRQRRRGERRGPAGHRRRAQRRRPGRPALPRRAGGRPGAHPRGGGRGGQPVRGRRAGPAGGRGVLPLPHPEAARHRPAARPAWSRPTARPTCRRWTAPWPPNAAAARSPTSARRRKPRSAGGWSPTGAPRRWLARSA